MHLHPDFRDLLGELVRAAARFAVIGGYAVAVHGRPLGPTEVAFLGVPPLRGDLLRTVDGVSTDEVLQRTVEIELDGLRVPVIALDDLITNKRAAGRPQDLADVVALERVRARWGR